MYDYFGNSDVRMVNFNNTKIPYIFFSNNPSDFSIMSQCNRVIYIANVVHKAEFVLRADIFIVQLCNFLILIVDGLHIIQSIIYKTKLEKT